MKRLLHQLTHRLGVQVSRYQEDPHQTACVTLRPSGKSRGNVLLAYILQPFLDPVRGVSSSHTHFGESRLMAQTFLDLGYNVDAISYRNADFEPPKEYAVFVSARTNLHRLAPRLNASCLKIAHLDTCHWVFNNQATYRRTWDLQQRRQVSVNSLRIIEPNRAIETADCGVVLGNAFTLGTYRYAGKPLYALQVPTVQMYPWPAARDVSAARRHFLWLGSHSLVHKGLDLVLEAFAGLPDYHLTVCAPLHLEKEFEHAFAQELYRTPNIHTAGWVDVTSPAFAELVARCAALIYPSCAEANAGSVVTCMQAGLMPIISQECGVDVEPFGEVLPDCSIASLRAAVERTAHLPPVELEQRCRAAWEHARACHTQDHYRAAYRDLIERLLSEAQGRAGAPS